MRDRHSRAVHITQLLADWNRGDQAALDKLLPLVYAELHRLAGSYMRRERPEHTLQTTAFGQLIAVSLQRSACFGFR
jgi:ECF sigma factor